MQLNVSFLPAYGAAFILMFARIGTMIMLLPGLGEMSVPMRVRLTIALFLTAILLPLHRGAYPLDPGYERRRPLHQLYPLLVHLNHFGERYGPDVEGVCRRVLN